MHSDPEVVAFIPEGAMTPEEARRKIALHIVEHWGKFGYGMYSAFLKESGRMIGRCGFLHQDLEGEELCEVAYLIARDHWGRGFATEAAQALVQHGFEVMGEDLLVSLINRENQRSVRVAIKAGMKLLKEFPCMYKYGIYRVPGRATGHTSD